LDLLEGLQAGDGSARLPAAFQEVERAINEHPADANHVVYVLSDLRRRDWLPAAESTTNGEQAPELLAPLRRLADQAAGCFVIDTAEEGSENLMVTAIVPQEKS